MAANASDMFQKVARSTATTLSAPGYTVGATSINVASTSNWPADTGITFGIDEVDGGGNRIAGTYNIFRGTVGSATQLANLTYVGGDANRNYSAGATTRVYILVSYARENRLVDGLLVSHDQDGTLKAGAVDGAGVLASNVVETAKIKDGAVTAEKLSTGAITLGYAQATTDFATSSGTLVDVTGLNVSVTIPSGGRRAKITFGCKFVKCDTPGYGNTIAILEGSTILQKYVWTTPASNHAINGFMVATTVPSAGVKTYKIQALSDAGATQTIVASSDAPSFILVELI